MIGTEEIETHMTGLPVLHTEIKLAALLEVRVGREHYPKSSQHRYYILMDFWQPRSGRAYAGTALLEPVQQSLLDDHQGPRYTLRAIILKRKLQTLPNWRFPQLHTDNYCDPPAKAHIMHGLHACRMER